MSLLLFALVALAAQAPPPARPSPAARPAAAPAPVLEGIVKGPDGKPVDKAFVQALASNARGWEPAHSTRTDAAGRFRIELPLAARAYTVRVEAAGLAPRRLSDVSPGRPLEVALARAATLEGTVRDSRTGAPVSKARIVVMDERSLGAGPPESGAGLYRAESDAKGQFRVEGLGPGFHSVSVQARGVGHGRRTNVRAGARLEILLVPGASLSGLVVGPQGRPIEGAFVSVMREVRAGGGNDPGPDRTDAQGRFEVAGLAPAVYWLQVQHKEYAPAVVTGIEVERGGAARIDVEMSGGSQVTGRLIDSGGKPLRGEFRLHEVEGQAAPSVLTVGLRAEAGADGRFTLPRVSPGSYVFLASAARVATQRVEVEVPRRATGPVDLGEVALAEGLTIRGHVRDQAGQPISGAHLRALLATGIEVPYPTEAQSEADGAFVVAGLATGGTYKLMVRAPGFGQAVREAETGAEGVKVVLVPGGSVTGVVVDEAGQPVEAFEVIADPERRSRILLLPSRERVSDPGGRFTLDDLAEGQYDVRAEAPDLAPGSVPTVAVKPGSTVDVGRIRLLRGGVVKGSVVDGSGGPVAGASVEARSEMASGFRAMPPRTTTDAAGAFEARGVGPGRVDVVATRDGYAPGYVSVEVDPAKSPAEARVVLAQGGRVEGWARRRDGRPLAGEVQVRRTAFGPPYLRPAIAPVRSDGSFVVEHVPAGRTQVLLAEASALPGRNALSQEVDVREGETVTVELLSREILVSGRVTRNGAAAPNLRVNVRPRRFPMAMTPFVPGRGVGAVPSGPQRGTAVTREDGSYELLLDAPGEASASVETLDGKTTLLWRSVQVPDGEALPLDLAVGGARLAGIVVDKQTGRAVPGIHIYVHRREKGERGLMGASTGPEGRFALEVEPGTYRLDVDNEDYPHHTQEVVVGEAGLADVRIELARGHSIEGRVVDAQGRPAPGAKVRASGRGGSHPVDARQDGTFRIGGLDSGSFHLFAERGAAFAARPAVAAGARDLVLTLQPGGAARVQVVDAEGAPVADARVFLSGLAGERVMGTSSSTDGQGYAALNLPAGAVELGAFKDKLHGKASVTVLPGGTVSVQIEVRDRSRMRMP